MQILKNEEKNLKTHRKIEDTPYRTVRIAM